MFTFWFQSSKNCPAYKEGKPKYPGSVYVFLTSRYPGSVYVFLTSRRLLPLFVPDWHSVALRRAKPMRLDWMYEKLYMTSKRSIRTRRENFSWRSMRLNVCLVTCFFLLLPWIMIESFVEVAELISECTPHLTTKHSPYTPLLYRKTRNSFPSFTCSNLHTYKCCQL